MKLLCRFPLFTPRPRPQDEVNPYWLSPQGQPAFAREHEANHVDIGERLLRAAGVAPLDGEDVNVQLWQRGWLRVMAKRGRIETDRIVDGQPTAFEELPAAQRAFMDWVSGSLQRVHNSKPLAMERPSQPATQ